jgi:septation ring formation regulator EzrA
MTPEQQIPPRPDGFAGTLWDLTFGAGQKASKFVEAKAAFDDIKGTVSKDAVYFIQFMDDINKLTNTLETVNANLEQLNEHMTALIPNKKED